jgi:hypothetical protein
MLSNDEAAWIDYASDCMALHPQRYNPNTQYWIPKISFLFWTQIKVKSLTADMALFIKTFTNYRFAFTINDHIGYNCIMFENKEDAFAFSFQFYMEIIDG